MSRETNEEKMKNVGRIKKEIDEQVTLKRIELDRALKRSEINKIKRSVKRRVIREHILRGVCLALGITIGAGGHALLTSGKEGPEEKPAPISGELGENDSQSFRDSMVVSQDGKTHIDPRALGIKEKTEEEKITEEVEGLKTEEQVLDWVKDFYIGEYNEEYGTNYKASQVEFYWARQSYDIRIKMAENGDSILQICPGDEGNYVRADEGIITATIKDGDNQIKQSVFNNGLQFKTLYGENEKVQRYQDNFLVDVAPVIDTGLKLRGAILDPETGKELVDNYRARFIDQIIDYNNEKAQENDGMEMDD